MQLINLTDKETAPVSYMEGAVKRIETLLKEKDVSEALSLMTTSQKKCKDAYREYATYTHGIMSRPDKVVKDKKGNVVRLEKQWKLPIAYPTYINEIALVFLFGQPLKWKQDSDETDRAYQSFLDFVKRTRFDSKIRQCKRLAGAETESALLFHVYKNEEGRSDVVLKVLAHSLGDEIYMLRDNYGTVEAIAWKYKTKDENKDEQINVEIYTARKEFVCQCKEHGAGWSVTERPNIIGKIPIIVFQQEKEWAGVEQLIEREEYIASRTADTNDYYCDPTMIVNADSIASLPEKSETGRLLIARGQNISNAVQMVTWDSAPASKLQEIEWLQNQILNKSFTPNISLDTFKSLGNLSGKALRTVMMLADIKANRNKEIYDEMIDRTANLIKAVIGNVLDVSLSEECERLKVSHIYREPFGEDVNTDLSNLATAVNTGIISKETAIELNPMIKDVEREKQRMAQEEEAGNKSLEELERAAYGSMDY